MRGCREGKKETEQQSINHISTRVTQITSADIVHKGRQHGRGIYKQVATVDSHTRAVANGPVGPAMAGPIIEPVIRRKN